MAVSKTTRSTWTPSFHAHRGGTVNRLNRVLAVTAASALVVPAWAAPASAETLAETASVAAYYLASNPGTVGEDIQQNPLGGQKAPDNAKNADGVAQDDLAVAVVLAGSGEPDKFSALQWELLDLTTGATVSKATFTIPFSEKDDSRSTDRDATLVQACLAGPEGFGDGDGEPFKDAPTRDCDAVPPAKATPVEGGKALEFDVTAIAQKWVDELNTGLVLVPSEAGSARPFQTVFGDKSTARLTVAFTGGVEDEVPLDDSETLVDDGSLDTTADSGFDSGLGDSSFDAGSFSTPSSDTSSFSGSSALDLPALPTTTDAPAVATQDPVTAAPQPVVRTGGSGTPMGFDLVTWLALLGGAGLLFVVSMALGASTTPGAAAAAKVRPGGVASALAARRGGGLARLSA